MNKNLRLLVMGVFLIFGGISYAFSFYGQRVAPRCQFTGDYGDYCMVGEVGRNVKVLRCIRGTTSCYYDEVPTPSDQ